MFTWPTPLKYPESKPSTPLTPLKYPECTWTWTRGTLVEVARGGKQVHRGNSRGVLASLRVDMMRSQWCTWLGGAVLELKLHEENSKYTEAQVLIEISQILVQKMRNSWDFSVVLELSRTYMELSTWMLKEY